MGDIAKLLIDLTATNNILARVAKAADTISESVQLILSQLLQGESESEKPGDIKEFREDLQRTQDLAANFKQCCLQAITDWSEFENLFLATMQQEVIEMDLVAHNKISLRDALLRAEACKTAYVDFIDSLQVAIDKAKVITEQYNSAAAQEISQANMTKVAGYSVAAALLFASIFFLPFASGGVAAVGAAATGAGALCAGIWTYSQISKLTQHIKELDDLRKQLELSRLELQYLEESLGSLFQLTEKVEESVQVAMQIFSEFEQVRKNEIQLTRENLILQEKSSKLEAQNTHFSQKLKDLHRKNRWLSADAAEKEIQNLQAQQQCRDLYQKKKQLTSANNALHASNAELSRDLDQKDKENKRLQSERDAAILERDDLRRTCSEMEMRLQEQSAAATARKKKKRRCNIM